MRNIKIAIRYASYFFAALVCSSVVSYAASIFYKSGSTEFSNKPLFDANTIYAHHICDPNDPTSTGDSSSGDDGGGDGGT